MGRKPRVWWNRQKQAWRTDIGGTRRVLAKGRASRRLARHQLHLHQEETRLL